MKLSLISILISAVLLSAADFLIVPQPQDFAIFDQYEQPLSDTGKNRFPPFSPFQVIKRNELMGDQITEAVRLSCRGSTYYLPRGNKTTDKLLLKILGNCSILNDSVLLKKDIKVYTGSPSGAPSFTIKADQQVIRVFRHGNNHYLLTSGQNGRYGWYSGSADVFRAGKTTVKVTSTRQDDLAGIEQIVKKRIESVNETYHSIFGYFNHMTNQGKLIPSWSVVTIKNAIQCRLSGSSQMTGQLEQSTRYIVQDIEQSLLGKPYSVSYKSGLIEIGPREN